MLIVQRMTTDELSFHRASLWKKAAARWIAEEHQFGGGETRTDQYTSPGWEPADYLPPAEQQQWRQLEALTQDAIRQRQAERQSPPRLSPAWKKPPARGSEKP